MTELKYHLMSRYILQCFAMLSSLDNIKSTELYNKEVKYYSNKLLESLTKEASKQVFTDLSNMDKQEIVFTTVNALEEINNKISKLNITERIILNNILDDLTSGDIPDKYKKPKIKELVSYEYN